VYALFQKGGVELERLPFARDAVATLTLTIVLVSVYGNGATTEPKAWTLIGLYAAYVCVVVLPGWVKALRHTSQGVSAASERTAKPSTNPSTTRTRRSSATQPAKKADRSDRSAW
jgi:hypothetical protein